MPTFLQRINEALRAKAPRYQWDRLEQKKAYRVTTKYLQVHAASPHRTMNRRGDYFLMEVTKKSINGDMITTSKFKKGHVDIIKLAKQLGIPRPKKLVLKKSTIKLNEVQRRAFKTLPIRIREAILKEVDVSSRTILT